MINPLLHFNSFFEDCKKRFPNLCHKCPLHPGIIAVNYTETMEENGCPKVQNKNMPSLASGKWFPDGDYKSHIMLYSGSDLEVLTINYYFKIKNGDNKSF